MLHIYIYIYITYRERQKEREKERQAGKKKEQTDGKIREGKTDSWLCEHLFRKMLNYNNYAELIFIKQVKKRLKSYHQFM